MTTRRGKISEKSFIKIIQELQIKISWTTKLLKWQLIKKKLYGFMLLIMTIWIVNAFLHTINFNSAKEAFIVINSTLMSSFASTFDAHFHEFSWNLFKKYFPHNWRKELRSLNTLKNELTVACSHKLTEVNMFSHPGFIQEKTRTKK